MARPSGPERSVFIDPRGDDRALRATWHHADGLVSLSLWRDNVCVGSFRLDVDEVPRLIEMLRSGLEREYTEARDRLRDASAS